MNMRGEDGMQAIVRLRRLIGSRNPFSAVCGGVDHLP
jgi:hypothetical protein